MKKYFIYITALIALVLSSCNEELYIEGDQDRPAPVFTSFEPASGAVGTLISITGENLQDISKVYIDNKEVALKSKINGELITIIATQEGRTGNIKIANTKEETAESTTKFTYNYPTPAIATLPVSFKAGEEIYLNGTNLNAVQEVWFESVDGEERMQVESFINNQTELIFTIPNIKGGDTKIDLVYFNGTESTIADGGQLNVINEAVVITTDLSGTYKIGEEVVCEGRNLLVVTKVLLGDVEMPIMGETTPTSITFKIVDNPSFVDGENTFALNLEMGEKSQVEREAFKIHVPTFYLMKDAHLTGRDLGAPIVNLRTGQPVANSKDAFAALDPISAGLGFASCSAVNVLKPAVTEEQYYSVDPYLPVYILGSGLYIYGPTARSGGIGQSISGVTFGTPIMSMFVLNPANPAEKNIIDKVTAGTFTEADFDKNVFKSIELQGRSTSGSLRPNKLNDVLGFAPDAPTSIKKAYDANPGTVALVMQMKPVYDSFKFSFDNVARFGLLDINNINYVDGQAYKASVKFDIYWQRTADK